MWKKDEEDPTARPEAQARSRPERSAERTPRIENAVIGPSISIKGDVTGDEDLLIEGRVDGSVDLKQHSVTVGSEGNVKANISGRVITVEGKVEGNLRADEQVVLRSSAVVEGDITAARVVLEDGAQFRGGVDMGQDAGRGGRAGGGTGGATGRQSPTPEPSRTSKGEKAESAEEEKSETDSSARTTA